MEGFMSCKTFKKTSPHIAHQLLKPLAAAGLALMASGAPAQIQDYCSTTNIVKWLQPPQVDGGLDVQDTHRIVLADDFLCTNAGLITDIHLWGSWSNNLVGSISNFYLFIYSDVPVGPNNPTGFSYPGTLLWQQTFQPGQYSANIFSANGEEYFWDPSNNIIGGDSIVWQFCFQPPATNPFPQTGSLANPIVYWLVAYAGGIPNTNDYGWKSSTTNWNDAAVWGSWNNVLQQPMGNWAPMFNPNIPTQQLDLSFEIFGSTNIPTTNCCSTTNTVKWLQPPDFNGVDVQDSQGIVLADDFLCTNAGFITDIHLWGSWWNDAPGPIQNFDLFIYSDVPAYSPSNTLGYSYPGNLLWHETFAAGQFCSNALPSGNEYFLNPSNGLYLPEKVPWEFCFTPTNPYLQTGTLAADTVYWLVASAGGIPSTYVFGWKTSTTNWNDPAVWGSWDGVTGQPMGNWTPIPNPFTGAQLDLSFEVFTSTNCLIPYSCSPDKQVQCGSTWVFDPPAVGIENCCPTAPPSVTFNGAVTNGDCPQIATASWTITDCLGHSVVCAQNVTILDTTPPTITCPSNIIGTTCTSSLQVWWTVSASACSGTNVTVTSTPPSGSYFNAGTTTTVTNTAVDLCGNTNTCFFTVTVTSTAGKLKYIQPPNLTGGFDLRNNAYAFADDFVCTNTGPITDIHLWGSWLNDQALPGSITYWLAFYSDVPAVGSGFSHPGKLLWSQVFSPGSYTETLVGTGQEQFFDPGNSSAGLGFDSQVWYYCFNPATPFIQEGTVTAPQLYWLMAFAQLPAGVAAESGWKTTPVVQNDSAVFTAWPGGFPLAGWGTPFLLPSGTPVDLAFQLSTQPNPVTINCPSNIIGTTCTSNLQVSWTNVSASSSCSGTNVTVTSTPPSGSFFNADTTNTVIVTASDLCGNTNTCSFTVAVTRPVLGPITYTRTATTFTLNWANGILQSCTNLMKPSTNWVDVPGANPPSFTTNFSGVEEFFRLRCESP
jgi:hypothetical protein